MWLNQSAIPCCSLLYPPRMQENISLLDLSARSLLPMFSTVLSLRKKHVAEMRACLPCLDSPIPGQVKENNFSKSNCTYPNRKAGSCKKRAEEVLSERLWQKPRLTAGCGSNGRRGSVSWEPHISVKLHSGLEATGSCWHDPHQTHHLKKTDDWGEEAGRRFTFKSFIQSVSCQRFLLSPFTSLPPQHERDKDSLHAPFIEKVWNWHLSSGQQGFPLTETLLF